MSNTDMAPVEAQMIELKKEERSGKRKFDTGLSAYDLLIRVLGIFFSRAMLIGGYAPFGLAFLCQERRFSLKSIVTAVCVSIGYGLLMDPELALRYITACVVYEIFLFIIDRNSPPNCYITGAAAAGILAVCGVGTTILFGFTAYKLIFVFADVLLLLIGIIVFDKSRKALFEKRILLRKLELEEKVSLCVMAGVILLSLKDVSLFGAFNFSHAFACLCIMFASVCGGLTAGAVSGICAGAALGIGGDFMSMTAVYGVCGLAAGLSAALGISRRFERLIGENKPDEAGEESRYIKFEEDTDGEEEEEEERKKIRAKYPAAIFMVIAGVIAILYMGTYSEEILNFYELLSAAVVGAFLPSITYRIGFKTLGAEEEEKEDPDRFKEYVADKLSNVADSFDKLSETFNRISDKQSSVDMSDVSALFDTAADRVCVKCQKVDRCWRREFNTTYKTMFKLLEIMERKGYVTVADVPSYFGDNCAKLGPLLTEINRLFEVYKINRTWKRRLAENRELTGEQFSGIAEIIRNVSKEICEDMFFDVSAALEIKKGLKERGVDVKKVDVVKNRNERYIVEISVKNEENAEIGAAMIRPVLRKVLDINFALPVVRHDEKTGVTELKFSQIEAFSTSVGVACASKQKECGDKYLTNYLSGGKIVVTLSDGMGSGHAAAKESEASVTLLSDFLEAGFDKTIAVKLVNSIMVMKSASDAFATVDMCVIDLYTGEVEFIKNGAEPSYIKHADHTEVVRAASLPVGIVSAVDIQTFARTLKNNSVVVMMTDGVSLKNGDDSWLKEIIDAADHETPPKILAEDIITKSVELSGGQSDDMTVICIRVSDKRSAGSRHSEKRAKKAGFDDIEVSLSNSASQRDKEDDEKTAGQAPA